MLFSDRYESHLRPQSGAASHSPLQSVAVRLYTCGGSRMMTRQDREQGIMYRPLMGQPESRCCLAVLDYNELAACCVTDSVSAVAPRCTQFHENRPV